MRAKIGWSVAALIVCAAAFSTVRAKAADDAKASEGETVTFKISGLG
jgi:ABC-type proline/glycine betaine transport system substrate-binding protein